MQASDYLRARFQSDRRLALAAEGGFNKLIPAIRSTASDIYAGAERAAWYTSCLIPAYGEVCRELATEEIRSFYAVQSIYKHRDVIQHMLYLYFKLVCEDIKEGNPDGSARKLVKGAAAIAKNMTAATSTKYALAVAISQALAQSLSLSKVVTTRLSAKMDYPLSMLQIFGIQQKIAMAARKLRAINPTYYWLLYHERVEMLYYFIEPVISDVMQNAILNKYSNMDELVDELREKYHV